MYRAGPFGQAIFGNVVNVGFRRDTEIGEYMQDLASRVGVWLNDSSRLCIWI